MTLPLSHLLCAGPAPAVTHTHLMVPIKGNLSLASTLASILASETQSWQPPSRSYLSVEVFFILHPHVLCKGVVFLFIVAIHYLVLFGFGTGCRCTGEVGAIHHY